MTSRTWRALRLLGFTSIAGNGALAVVQGEMTILIQRSYEDQLALIITLPNGDELLATIPRDDLRDDPSPAE